jgi:hypothetical protein
MRVAGFLVGSEKAIGELRAAVGEDGFDAGRAGFTQSLQEIKGIFLCLIRINLKEHPAGCTVSGDKEGTVTGSIGHFWKGFDIDIQKPGSESPLQ